MTDLALDAAALPAAEADAAPFGKRVAQAVYCAFVVSIPFETILYWQQDQADQSSGVSLSRVLGMLLLGVAVVEWRVCFKKIPGVFWAAAWYVGFFTLSQLWIPPQLDARFHELQMTFVQMLALFLVSYNLLSDPAFRRRLLTLYGWAIFLVAVAMLTGVLGVTGDETNEMRSSILAQNANLSANLFAVGALCLAGDADLLRAKKLFSRGLVALGAVATLAVAVLRTGSRGGLLSLCAGMLALAACGNKTTRKARAVIVGLGVFVLGGLVALEFKNGTSTAQRLENTWDNGDNAGRTGIYDAAWAMFLEKPLFGYGGAQNRFVLATMLDYADQNARNPDRDTHDIFLAVLTEVGVVGGLPFLLALLWTLWAAWRFGRRAGVGQAFALMTSLLLINTTMTGTREKIFWIVLAAASAVGGP